MKIDTDRRWTTGPDTRDPHRIMRITGNGEVLIKYTDKTTEWWSCDEYFGNSEEAP